MTWARPSATSANARDLARCGARRDGRRPFIVRGARLLRLYSLGQEAAENLLGDEADHVLGGAADRGTGGC